MQLRRDVWMEFRKLADLWRDGTLRAWDQALLPAARVNTSRGSIGSLELVDTEVVENKIIASRLALDLMENSAQEVNDLRNRLKFLTGDRDLSVRDIVHPEVLFLVLVEQWEQAGLSRAGWQLVSKVVQLHFNEQLHAAYAQCNAELIDQDVMPTMDYVVRGEGADDAPQSEPSQDDLPLSDPADRPQAGYANLPRQRSGRTLQGHGDDRLRGSMPAFASANADMRRAGDVRPPQWRRGGAAGDRAQGVLQQVGRLLGGFFNPDGPSGSYQTVSNPLMAELEQQAVVRSANLELPQAGDQLVVIDRAMQDLRQRSTELKVKAQTDGERSIIELVALMFQAILQEDRIASGVRVWFARLQMPVLRLALAEPNFFGKLDHPARQLIDHMGSCALGFDASGVTSSALEQEVKRVVQVIEQYPETGDRVFRKVYEEFQAFLKYHLTQNATTQRVVGVAQQLEQREALTIRYTIDLRDQLKDMPVRDEIRVFLFKVWAEVLAVSAVRYGAQHEQTLRLKKTAADLIWAASGKPNRADRARVISTLPDLLQSLRDGMTLSGLKVDTLEEEIKAISSTLVDAFMSKTEAISEDQIQALADHLAGLEDFIADGDLENLQVNAQTLEDLLGIDASNLDGEGRGSVVMMEWVRELDLGSWHSLDHNGVVSQVQYVWRSPLQHLHLFTNSIGRSYLFESHRLAGYLQRGLVVPYEEEPLLTRATRDALGKIEVNPERLFS